MPTIYVFHIAAGSLALLAGYVALYSVKGAALHRRSGQLFVYAMLTMAVLGATIAAVRGEAPAINIPAALVTAYLVITALLTVRAPVAQARRLDLVLLLVALAVGIGDFALALGVFDNGSKALRMPFPLFGSIALLAAAGDLHIIRSGALRGGARVARHLWRMCVALSIAALSFFIGQAKAIPEPIRIMPLLALPVLLVLVTMFYWLWRVRVRRSLRGLVVRATQPARVIEA